MDTLTVALGQIDVRAGDPRFNADRIIAEVVRAKERLVDVIVFPELSVPGYLVGDVPEQEAFVREVWYQNERIVAATAGSDVVVIFGTYAIDHVDAKGKDGRVRKLNAGIVAHRGAALKNRAGLPFFAKTLLPTYRMFDDERHFFSLRDFANERQVPLQDALAPFDITLNGNTYRIGVMVCEDMWDQDYVLKPMQILTQQGVDVVVNISCSPWGWQKNRARHSVVKRLCASAHVPFIYVNATGVQNNGKDFIVFDGSSTAYNEAGFVAHAVTPYADCVEDFVLTAHLPEAPHTEATDVTQLWNGIERGLRGFIDTVPPNMRKAVVGLSGGIDSAVVAALMVHVLGKENVIGITMPYRDYNSRETRTNAKAIADALGIQFDECSIDALVDAQAAMHDILPGTSPFKTVQAIARMTVLAARAGAVNGFFTSNGNKSELAFGYYTLNGDGRGAIAPLGDLLKGEVYQLAHYMNTVVFGREVIPRAVMDVAPMDELGPQGTGTRKDPFDYGRITPEGVFVRGYHDAMVHAIVGFRKDAEWFLECYMQGTLEQELGLDEGTVASLFAMPHDFVADLERCFSLFSNAIWKRVQSVPLILVSKRAFGWDYRESVLPPFRSTRYEDLKEKLLA